MRFNPGTFWIIDETDRPIERHVVECLSEEGLCRYIFPSLRGWYAMRLSEKSTKLEDFGFLIVDHKNGGLSFVKMRPSVAKYSNGKPRRWQGKRNFLGIRWFDYDGGKA